MDSEILRFECVDVDGKLTKSCHVHVPEGILTDVVYKTVTTMVLVPYLESVLRHNMKVRVSRVA